jgi:hypothetical protein
MKTIGEHLGVIKPMLYGSVDNVPPIVGVFALMYRTAYRQMIIALRDLQNHIGVMDEKTKVYDLWRDNSEDTRIHTELTDAYCYAYESFMDIHNALLEISGGAE